MDRHLFRQTFFRWTEANGQTVFADRQTLFILETEKLIFRKTDRETEETETIFRQRQMDWYFFQTDTETERRRHFFFRRDRQIFFMA